MSDASPSSEKPQKITIGFLGGQTLIVRVAPDALAALRAALPAGGWHDVPSDDGTTAVDLAKVVYVQVDAEGHRVGFGI